jgi:dipeptidase E
MAEPSKKQMLLLSGSKAAGNLPQGEKPGFLDFAEVWIKDFFTKQIQERKPILFVPYARPDGMPEKDYFAVAQKRLKTMGIDAVCAPTEGITDETLKNVGGIFIGGGHTYTLLTKLQKSGSLAVIRKHVDAGLPYLGSSAGTIIACPTIKTTNDMPCPATDVIDLKGMGIIRAQLNCHYMDNAMHDPKHQGETRDTRLKEFCAFNPNTPVLGLYEGQALRVTGKQTYLLTSERTRGQKPPIFLNGNRDEIECEIGVPKDVSHIFEVREQRVDHAVTTPPSRSTSGNHPQNQPRDSRGR